MSLESSYFFMRKFPSKQIRLRVESLILPWMLSSLRTSDSWSTLSARVELDLVGREFGWMTSSLRMTFSSKIP